MAFRPSKWSAAPVERPTPLAQRQIRVALGVLPTAVVHRVDTPPAKWEDPDWVQRSLRFYDRPSDIIQNCNMSTSGVQLRLAIFETLQILLLAGEAGFCRLSR